MNRKRYIVSHCTDSFPDYAISQEKLSSCHSDCKNVALLLSATSSEQSQILPVGSKQTFLMMTLIFFLINFECFRCFMAFECCVDLLSRNSQCFPLLSTRTQSLNCAEEGSMLTLRKKYSLQQSTVSAFCSFKNLQITMHPSTAEYDRGTIKP